MASETGTAAAPSHCDFASTTFRRSTQSPCSAAQAMTLRVNGAAEVGVEVPALRHAMEERAQRRTIVARCFEGGRGDDRVEFARQHRQAQQDDEGRQEDDGKDDPMSQGLPRCARYSAKLERISVKWNQGVRRAQPPPFAGEGVTENALLYCVPLPAALNSGSNPAYTG